MGLFDIFKKEKSKTFDELMDEGNYLASKGNFKKAIASYSEAIKKSVKESNIQLKQGTMFSDSGDFEKAASYYAQIINQGEKNAFAYYVRALAYLKLNDINSALSDYSEIIKMYPHDVDIYCKRGDLHIERKDYIKAHADFSEAIKFAPKFVNAYLGRSRTYYYVIHETMSGKDEKRIDDLFKGLGVFALRELFRKMMEDCNVILAIDENNDTAYMRRGSAYGFLGYLDKAINDFEKINASKLPDVKILISEMQEQMRYKQMGVDGNGDKIWI